VRQALEESVQINRTASIRATPAAPVSTGIGLVRRRRSAQRGHFYGHNVEFGWLMVEAEKVLGRPRPGITFARTSNTRWPTAGMPNAAALQSREDDGPPRTAQGLVGAGGDDGA
jgi:hypothetical protein